MRLANTPKIDNVIIAAGPVIIEDGYIWLNRKHDSDMWMIPGGRAEESDIFDGDPAEALQRVCRRECREENNIDIRIIAPLQTLLLPRPDAPGSWAILVHFLAERIGEPTPGAEISEVKKFPIASIIDGTTQEKFAPNVRLILVSYLRQSA